MLGNVRPEGTDIPPGYLEVLELGRRNRVDEGPSRSTSETEDSTNRVVQIRRFTDKIVAFISDLGPHVTEGEVDSLRTSFPNRPSVDYDKLGVAFAHTYFIRNFLKAWYCFENTPPTEAQSIADIGSGSGAALLAYLLWLNTRPLPNRRAFHVLAIDRSEGQLDLLKQLLELVTNELGALDVSLQTEAADFREWDVAEDNTDLILMSHVLSENPWHIGSMIDKAFDWLRPGGSIYVIDQDDDGFWRAFDKATPHLIATTFSGRIEIDNSEQVLASIRDEGTGRDSCRYLVIHAPIAKSRSRLLRLYFEAWEQQSVEMLESVFAQDARYEFKPGRSALVGLESIKTYWREKVLPQRDIQTRVMWARHETNETLARWEARFRTDSRTTHLEGSLRVRFNAEADRITHFHEDYATRPRRHEKGD